MGYIGIQMTILRKAAFGLLMLFLPFVGYSQSKRAFLVGISNYSSNLHLADGKGWNDIHGENDVKLLVPTLKKQGFSNQVMSSISNLLVMDNHLKIMMAMRVMDGMKLWSHSMPLRNISKENTLARIISQMTN